MSEYVSSNIPEDIIQKHHLALKYLKDKKHNEALRLFDEILLARPDYAAAFNNRGTTLRDVGAYFDAILNFDCAIALDPETVHYYNNRGACLADLGQYASALEAYDKALALNPKFDLAYMNRGNVFRAMGDTSSAIPEYRKAVAVNPDNQHAHLGLSMSLLEVGNYAEGFVEFECRWKVGQMPPRGLPIPEWEGQSIPDGKALLIYGEQGFGDDIQFCRFIKSVKKLMNCKVYLEVRSPLVRLMSTLDGGPDKVISFGEKIPSDVAYCVAMLSVPRIIGLRIDNIPNTVPYFNIPNEADAWKQDLDLLPPGLRIGLCWAGMSRPGQATAELIDQRRSMTLDQFAPLAQIPGISWVSLQLGPPLEHIKSPPTGMTILDVSNRLTDFRETASLVSQLDLVITVDTAVCHVAGAMGVPTWMLSRFDGCWRWLGDREDSPWYPTLRQFRQPKQGDWESVIKKVSSELREYVRDKRNQAPELPKVSISNSMIPDFEPNLEGLPNTYMLQGELEVLLTLIRMRGPASMLEIGVNEGRTAKAVLKNIPSIETYVGVDVNPGHKMSLTIQDSELPEVPGKYALDDPRFKLLLSANGSLDLTDAKLDKYDVVFIDGDHSKEAVKYDTSLAMRVLKPGGIIIWHDYSSVETLGVKEVLDNLRKEGRKIVHVKGTWLAYELR